MCKTCRTTCVTCPCQLVVQSAALRQAVSHVRQPGSVCLPIPIAYVFGPMVHSLIHSLIHSSHSLVVHTNHTTFIGALTRPSYRSKARVQKNVFASQFSLPQLSASQVEQSPEDFCVSEIHVAPPPAGADGSVVSKNSKPVAVSRKCSL